MNSEPLFERLKHGVARWLILGASVSFVLVIIYSILRIGFVIGLYNYFAQWITVHLGLDYYLANFAGVLMAAGLTFILPSILWYLLAGRRKGKAIIAIAGTMGLICILIYTVGNDVYFNRTTGEPLRYFADTPEGRVFSFTPGFDPKYDIEFKSYTREEALKNKNPQQFSSQGAIVVTDKSIIFSDVYTEIRYGINYYRIQPIEIITSKDIINIANLKVSFCNTGRFDGTLTRLSFQYTDSPTHNSLNWESDSYQLVLNAGECKIVYLQNNSGLPDDYKFLKPLGKLYISGSNDGNKIGLFTFDLNNYK